MDADNDPYFNPSYFPPQSDTAHGNQNSDDSEDDDSDVSPKLRIRVAMSDDDDDDDDDDEMTVSNRRETAQGYPNSENGDNRRASGLQRTQHHTPSLQRVFVISMHHMMPVSQELATKFTLNGDNALEISKFNHSVAVTANRSDLAKIWATVVMLLRSLSDLASRNKLAVWVAHPFGRSLANSIIRSLTKSRDVQTLALVLCIFQRAAQEMEASWFYQEDSSLPNDKPPPSQPIKFLHTHFGDAMLPRTSQFFRQQDLSSPTPSLLAQHTPHHSACFAYADLLLRWGWSALGREVMKFVDVSKLPPEHVSVVYDPEVPKRCGLCQLPVNGMAVWCVGCGHGGHSDHMKLWFQKHLKCAVGCGCSCCDYI
eukprot:c16233_g1_i1.p1 GENE.c16233_g1_i1~~c16233_g1_i1.p1  ORF type:complete len:386 (+),score=88.72 c16233_g1_i1:53-1159(+)